MLRIDGASQGADDEVRMFQARGLPVFRSIARNPAGSIGDAIGCRGKSMKAPVRIETARLLLVRPDASDAASIFERYASDPEVTRFLGWPRHQSVDDTKAFLRFRRTSGNVGLPARH